MSDHVTSIYREGGYGGVILSNSPGDLQWYTGVIPRSDADTGQLRVNMAVYDHGATHQEMRQALFAQLALLGARTNQSVVFAARIYASGICARTLQIQKT